MTPFSEMTNSELDRWIAEKRGTIIYQYTVNGIVSKANPTELISTSIDQTIVSIPLYTTDPRYAMELLKEMKGIVGFNAALQKWECNSWEWDENIALPQSDIPERAISEAWAVINE